MIQKVVRGWLASKGADIASAATTDLGAVEGNYHDITGTSGISSFGTVSAGIHKLLKFEGALTITNNATSMILLGGENRTTAVGDVGWYVSEGSGNWRELMYFPVAINPAKMVSTDETQTLTNKTLTSPTISGTLNLSGGQIAFPASQSASADANTLDDYEEGTWTPSVGGTATYSTQTGRYTKIGRLVSIEMILTIGVIGTGSTETISGLPFSCNASIGGTFKANDYNLVASPNYIVGRVNTSASTMTLRGNPTENGAIAESQGYIGNGATFSGGGFYSV